MEEEDSSTRTIGDVLKNLVKWENWENSSVIWQEAPKSITQGEEDLLKVRKAWVFEHAKVAIGALMLDHKEIYENCCANLS